MAMLRKMAGRKGLGEERKRAEGWTARNSTSSRSKGGGVAGGWFFFCMAQKSNPRDWQKGFLWRPIGGIRKSFLGLKEGRGVGGGG